MIKILVIDNKTELIDQIRSLIEQLPYSIEFFTKNYSNELSFESGEILPDFLFINCYEHKNESIELCNHIKQNDLTKKILVVLFIKNINELKKATIDSEADVFITVPLDEFDFFSKFKLLYRLKNLEENYHSSEILLQELEKNEFNKLQEYEENLRSYIDENRYSQLFGQIPYAILIIDPETAQPIDFNDQAYKQLGYSRGEFANLTIFDWEQPANFDKIKKLLEQLELNTYLEFESIHSTKAGNHINVLIHVNTVEWYGQKYIQAIIRDITKDKLSEEKLQKAEVLLKTANEQAPLGILVINADETIQMINPVALNLFGRNSENAKADLKISDLTQNTYYKADGTLYKPDEFPLKRAITGLSIENEEITFILPNGQKKYSLASATAILDPNGKIMAVVAFFPDITELKEAFSTLGFERDLLQSLIDNIPDSIFFKDTSCRFTRINKAMAKVLGLKSTSEANGKTDYDFFDVKMAKQSFKDDYLVLQTGQSIFDKIDKFTFSDGISHWWATTKIVINDKDGKASGILGITRDITNIKTSEQNLQIAKEKAEQSDRLKTEFLANMSHEIRTPMNAIVGFANLLSIPNISAEKRLEFIKHINDSCDNLLKLINDIIEIAKIQSGEVIIKKTEIRVAELMSELYETLREEKLNDQIKFKLKLPDDVQDVVILSDIIKIRQIMTSLVENAFKFTEEGYVEFGFIINDFPRLHLQFYVKDTGIGIEKGKLDIIFETFRKVNDRRTKLYGGTGLGLAIAKNLVKLLGGDMWVDSTPGIGSTFYFTTPYQPAKKQKNDEVQVKEINWNDKIILIAEDEELNYIFLQEALAKYREIKNVWAKNGKQAVEIFYRIPNIDLVLMDIKMPEMNGFEATKKIKEIRKNVPIIALTAYAMEGERENILKAGCDDYLSKPLKLEDIQNVLKKWLNE